MVNKIRANLNTEKQKKTKSLTRATIGSTGSTYPLFHKDHQKRDLPFVQAETFENWGAIERQKAETMLFLFRTGRNMC